MTRAFVFGVASLAGLGSAWAIPEIPEAADNPYTVISDRNVFHLNPPPPPKDAEAAKPLELPKVALTGFYGKGSDIRVLLAIPPAKDSKETAFTYFSLGPGDRDHDIQLVKIRPGSSEVEILNSGTLQTLSKSNNLASLGGAPHPSGGPERAEKSGLHRPMIPGFNPPQPGTPPAPASASMGGGGGGSLVIGGGDRESGNSGAFVSGGNSGGNGSLIAGGGGLSGGGVSTYGGSGTAAAAAAANNISSQLGNALLNQTGTHYQTPTPTAPPLPPVAQAVMMNAQKAAMGGGGPPLPPGAQVEEPPPDQ